MRGAIVKAFVLSVVVVLAGNPMGNAMAGSGYLNLQWSRTWGDIDRGEWAWGVEVRTDGVYLAGGTSSREALILKYDSNGNLQWSRLSGEGVFLDILLSEDGVFAFGMTPRAEPYDTMLVRYDFDGNQEWSRIWGTEGSEFGYGADVGNDGVYGTGRTADGDVLVLKYDFDGNLKWTFSWGMAYEQADDIAVASDGIYVVGFTGASPYFDYDALILKIGLDGKTELWHRTWKSPGSYRNWAQKVALGSDSIYVAGWTETPGIPNDAFLLQYDFDGNLIGETIWKGDQVDVFFSLAVGAGGIYTVGLTGSYGAVGGSDVLIAKYDFNLNLLWSMTWEGLYWDEGLGMDIFNGDIYITGITDYRYSYYTGDVLLLKYAEPIIGATVDIDPDTLDLKSEGKWITCYIELPAGYDPQNIDASSIVLEVAGGKFRADLEAPVTIADHDGDGVSDLMVKFKRSPIVQYLGTVDLGNSIYVEIAVTGTIKGSTKFVGTDTVRVISPGK